MEAVSHVRSILHWVDHVKKIAILLDWENTGVNRPATSRLTIDVLTDTDMWGDGTLALFFGMLVDGQEVDDTSVDPDVFFDAIVNDGRRHPLLMCPTGDFECCGSRAHTSIESDGWTVDIAHFLPKTMLSWDSVIDAGTVMLDAMERARSEYGVDPYIPSRKEKTMEGLGRYRKVLDEVAGRYT